MLSYILKRINSLDIHTQEVLKNSIASFVVKIVGIVIGLLVSVLLGRTLGASGLGIINLSNRIIAVVLVIALLGVRQVIIKEIAIAHSNRDFNHIGNIMHSVYFLNGSVSIVLSFILILISPWLANNIFGEPSLTIPLIVAATVVVPQVFSRIFSSALVGYRKIWQSNLVEQTLSIAITGVLLLFMWVFGQEINVNRVAIMYALGRLSVTITLGIYWKNIFKPNKNKIFLIKRVLKTSLPLFLVASSGIIIANANIIILGIFEDSKVIGIYAVAARIGTLTSFFLLVTNSSVSPKIAALFANNKMKELQIMIQRVTRILFFLGLSTWVLFIITGKPLLGIWGAEFKAGYLILIIIGFGQFLNLSTGAVGLMLIMTGNEKLQSKISMVFLIINILLNVLLIPIWGGIGAALATSVTTGGENITKLVFVKQRLGITTLKLW